MFVHINYTRNFIGPVSSTTEKKEGHNYYQKPTITFILFLEAPKVAPYFSAQLLEQLAVKKGSIRTQLEYSRGSMMTDEYPTEACHRITIKRKGGIYNIKESRISAIKCIIARLANGSLPEGSHSNRSTSVSGKS